MSMLLLERARFDNAAICRRQKTQKMETKQKENEKIF
jgi:hypothetical protein